MQSITANMHTLTHAAINDLQNAFQVCDTYPADGLILAALVKIRSIQDLLPGAENNGSDNNPEEFYRAA